MEALDCFRLFLQSMPCCVGYLFCRQPFILCRGNNFWETKPDMPRRLASVERDLSSYVCNKKKAPILVLHRLRVTPLIKISLSNVTALCHYVQKRGGGGEGIFRCCECLLACVTECLLREAECLPLEAECRSQDVCNICLNTCKGNTNSTWAQKALS